MIKNKKSILAVVVLAIAGIGLLVLNTLITPRLEELPFETIAKGTPLVGHTERTKYVVQIDKQVEIITEEGVTKVESIIEQEIRECPQVMISAGSQLKLRSTWGNEVGRTHAKINQR